MNKKQLMPKRYPKNKPSKDGLYVVYNKDSKSWGVDKWGGKYWMANGEWVEWFIDIPGAPDKVKPLKYPENKPSVEGLYVTHSKFSDQWKEAGYHKAFDNRYWNNVVDWFIPICLDEPVSNPCQLESEENMSLDRVPENISKVKIWYGDGSGLTCEWHRGCGLETMITEVADRFGYDVTKREPEIAPCPFCGGECVVYGGDSFAESQVQCRNYSCGYHSQYSKSKSEAIGLHNLIAERE